MLQAYSSQLTYNEPSMLKVIIPVLVLTGAVFLGKYLLGSGPEAKKKPFVERSPVVEILTLKPQDYTVTIKASGIVKAGTQTNLVSEVSGRIVGLSEDFKAGNYFNKNKVLITIDKANYENSLAIVKGDVAASRATLNQLNTEEKSIKRSYQLARKNLSLGKKEVNRLRGLWAKRLIARSALDIEEQKINQLQQKLEDLQGKLDTFKSRRQATDAKIDATLAREKQERLNLSRTTIKAPYEGRVLEKNVDVGQFVSMGTLLGKVYATDYVEVDLPLSLSRYELLNLPEAFKNKSIDAKSFPNVIFKNPNSRQKNEWQGRVVRSSAALDANSRQITVIARVDNPFDAKAGVTSPLRIGQYIEALIKGKTFKDVYVLPTISVRQNKEILLLEDGKIHVVPVNALWNTQTETIVRVKQDITGKQLVMTSLNQAIEGMKAITLKEQKIINNKNKKERTQ
ncbi:MAG: HlyD family efflux transporter periplasmic adaptor subunit [Cocleimonas sp.]|nr:HlyD family efflux transporter periplasmic adaptor subunit [Cocleimonas sp.]